MIHSFARCFSPVDPLPHRIAFACGAAWFSHIILDSFYNHGKGIAVMWPFGTGRLNFPIPWFETLRSPVDYTTLHSMKVMGIELLFYGILFLLVYVPMTIYRKTKRSERGS